jgi:hypothetical protein
MGGSIRVNVIVYKDERESFDDWLTSWKRPGEGRLHRKTRFEKSAVNGAATSGRTGVPALPSPHM